MVIFKAVKTSCIIEVCELDKVIQRELKTICGEEQKEKEGKKKHVCCPSQVGLRHLKKKKTSLS